MKKHHKTCSQGHIFEKSSYCLACPICSKDEMAKKYAGFPNIGASAFRALDREGITTLSDITKYTQDELLALHGFCPKALRLITHTLEEKKLFLGRLRKVAL